MGKATPCSGGHCVFPTVSPKTAPWWPQWKAVSFYSVLNIWRQVAGYPGNVLRSGYTHTHKVVTHSTHAFHVKQSVCLFAFLGKNNNIKIYMPFRTLANMPVINTNTMGIQKKNILITMFIVKLDVSNL